MPQSLIYNQGLLRFGSLSHLYTYSCFRHFSLCHLLSLFYCSLPSALIFMLTASIWLIICTQSSRSSPSSTCVTIISPWVILLLDVAAGHTCWVMLHLYTPWHEEIINSHMDKKQFKIKTQTHTSWQTHKDTGSVRHNCLFQSCLPRCLVI